MRPLRSAALGVMAFLFLLPAQAGAAPILDQQNLVLSSSLNGGSDDYAWQQGITAGIAGQLSRIDLFVDEVREGTTRLIVNLGAPWQSDASEWSLTAMLYPGWNSFNLTAANIFVAVGDQFTIGIHGEGHNIFPPAIGFSYGNQYLGGEQFLNGSVAEPVRNDDLMFRTYVDPVPEPASLLLLGTGLAGLACWRKRRG